MLVEFREKLDELLETTVTPKFKNTSFADKELEALKFYLSIMKPFALAIKALEGEDGVTYGDLLPRLCTVEIQLKKIAEKSNQGEAFQINKALFLFRRKSLSFECEFLDSVSLCLSVNLSFPFFLSLPTSSDHVLCDHVFHMFLIKLFF